MGTILIPRPPAASARPGSPGKTWVEVPGADHSSVLITPFPLCATLAEWVIAHAEGLC